MCSQPQALAAHRQTESGVTQRGSLVFLLQAGGLCGGEGTLLGASGPVCRAGAGMVGMG